MHHSLLTITSSVVLLLAATACTAGPADRENLPQPRSIEGDEVARLLPPDAIPAIDDPELVPVSEADFMSPDEPVLGLVRDGVAKAYSIWHLDRHEIVNDRIAGDPVAVTW